LQACHDLAIIGLAAVKKDPKLMFKYGGYQNEQFNIVYPHLLPSSHISNSLGHESFTYFYDGLLDILQE
jgi:hypothetical protein